MVSLATAKARYPLGSLIQTDALAPPRPTVAACTAVRGDGGAGGGWVGLTLVYGAYEQPCASYVDILMLCTSMLHQFCACAGLLGPVHANGCAASE